MPLVLLSGGMDSTVALYHTMHRTKEDPLYALIFRYGQRHLPEVLAANRIAMIASSKLYTCDISIPDSLFPDRSSSLFESKDGVKHYDAIPSHAEASNDSSFIPHRNLLFLAIAAGYARKWGCTEIVTGLRGGFPDCGHRFETAMEAVLHQSDPEFPITLSSPCHGSRAETIGLAYSLPGCWGALAYSMTCFEGTEPPCGKCLPCLKRAEGFAQFGKDDPLLERLAAVRAKDKGPRVPRY